MCLFKDLAGVCQNFAPFRRWLGGGTLKTCWGRVLCWVQVSRDWSPKTQHIAWDSPRTNRGFWKEHSKCYWMPAELSLLFAPSFCLIFWVSNIKSAFKLCITLESQCSWFYWAWSMLLCFVPDSQEQYIYFIVNKTKRLHHCSAQ